MTVAESTIKAICDYMESNKCVTCEMVADATNRARVTAREALSLMVSRGLVTKEKDPKGRTCGVRLLYTRTDRAYVPPEKKDGAYDFTELLKAWKVRACNAWSWSSRTHECVDEPLGFGEFADGTCL